MSERKVLLVTPQVRGWLAAGWRAYRRHWKLLAAGSVLATGMAAVCNVLLARFLSPEARVLPSHLLDLFFFNVLAVGWALLCLRTVRGEGGSLWTLFSGFRRYGSAFAVQLLYMLIVFAGALLLVIPAFVWGLKYSLARYALMDKGMGPREALRESGRSTHGYKLRLLELSLISNGIGILLAPTWAAWSTVLPQPQAGYTQCTQAPLCDILPEPWRGPMAIAGALMYPLALVVVAPWLSACHAAAYDELDRLRRQGESQGVHADPAGGGDEGPAAAETT